MNRLETCWQLTRKTVLDDIEWLGIGNEQRGDIRPKGKQPASGVIRHDYCTSGSATLSATVNAAEGRFGPPQEHLSLDWDRERNWRGVERGPKARRREFDDDHSMSSSEVHSISRMSSISFATVDSDPGPSRIPSQLQMLSLSPTMSPPLSPSSPWVQVQHHHHKEDLSRTRISISRLIVLWT